jgi:hypothetical protein
MKRAKDIWILVMCIMPGKKNTETPAHKSLPTLNDVHPIFCRFNHVLVSGVSFPVHEI